MKRFFLLWTILLTYLHFSAYAQITASSDSDQEGKNFTSGATLQGLNKVSTHISSLHLTKGETVSFGNLMITLHQCWQAPPEEQPENKALLEIWEKIPGEEPSRVFFGWMFSSSPAISALEHPVYDVTLLHCNKN